MSIVLTLLPPPEGTVVDVPLGQERAFVVSGTYAGSEVGLVEDLQDLSIIVMVAGHAFKATIDDANGSYQASVVLRCPSQPALVASLSARRWVETQGHGHWVGVAAKSRVLEMTVRDEAANQAYVITCHCVDAAGHALPGLDVAAFDRDPRSPDDPLGSQTQTDADGRVAFSFHTWDFTEHPGERYPDVYFRISNRGLPLGYALPGERNVNGTMNNFVPRLQPVIVHVLGIQGFVVQGAIRERWLQLGAHAGFLGRPVTDEARTPDGRGLYNHFEGGSIYWTPEWGALEVHGLIRDRWAALGWEQGFLGFPVTDEVDLPGTAGGRCSIFEHGIVTWLPGQVQAQAGPHHHERIYASVRAHILSRFYAVGPKGRRNQLSLFNRLQAPVPAGDPVLGAQARWRIAASDDENPFLFGSWVDIAMAVEQAAGHAESGRVLQASQGTLDSLMSWAEPGLETTSRFPQRWDAGSPDQGAAESSQFLDDGTGAYAGALPARDPHHHPRRANATLDWLLGPGGAELYRTRQGDYWTRYRRWETSMDEVTGLVTSRWVLDKLAGTPLLRNANVRQASQIGNYLANNGYLLVRPMGALSWRGSTGMLPAMEWPMARALGAAAGADCRSRIDFREAMQRAGYWSLLEGPVGAWQALGWSVAVLLPLLAGPLAAALAVTAATIEGIVSGQVLSPSTLAGAYAVYLHRDCFDIAGVEGGSDEQPEVALAVLCKDAPNKAGLYHAVATEQARYAPFRSWSVNFHSWLGLTGLDDPDPTVRDTFLSWFALRQAQPYEKEPKGQGSRSLFAAGVAALINDDADSERRLVDRLDQAIIELFRHCYFDPQLPVIDVDGHPTECCYFGHWTYEGDSRTPYSPIDFLVASALAFWHAQRRRDAGRPVLTERFPLPLDVTRMATWPVIAVPDTGCLDALTSAGIPIQAVQGNGQPVAGAGGYALFDEPVVARRPAPPTPIPAPASLLMCDIQVPVRATDAGDVSTGVTLFKDHEIHIQASGTIWGGGLLDPGNGPEGLQHRVDDARWPLHTGLDSSANAFCLVGRLNGYFRVGSELPRTRWRYHEERPLFLRVNDGGPGDGNGQFDVRIRVWGPEGADPSAVFQPPNVVRTGGVLRTVEAADLIEVVVEPGAIDANEVEFVLLAADGVTWRKEIIIRDAPATGTGVWTIWTQDGKRRDANGLFRYQLPGATLEFRKMKFGGGMWSMVTLSQLDAAPAGSRITFNWIRD